MEHGAGYRPDEDHQQRDDERHRLAGRGRGLGREPIEKSMHGARNAEATNMFASGRHRLRLQELAARQPKPHQPRRDVAAPRAAAAAERRFRAARSRASRAPAPKRDCRGNASLRGWAGRASGRCRPAPMQASVAKPRPQYGAGDPVAQLDRAGRPPAESARADQLRRAVAVRSKIRSEGSTGSRGAREKGLGVAHPVRPGGGREVARRSPRRQSRRQAPARPPGNPASAAVLAFSRTSSLLLESGRLAAPGDSFGRRIGPFQNEKGRRGGFPLLPCGLDLLMISSGPPPRGNGPFMTVPISPLSVIGMTWTYLRPSLPSRKRDRAVGERKQAYGPCPGRRCRPGATWCRAGAR